MADELDDMVLGPQGNRISASHMKAIDRLYWTPEERALGVHNLLENHLERLRKAEPKLILPSAWDKLCYAIELIGLEAKAIEDEEFLELAVKMARWLYSAHYSAPSKIYGPPDKKEITDQMRKEKKK